MSYPYIIQSNTVTVFIDNRPFTVNDSHMNYHDILNCIKNSDWSRVKSLVDVKQTLIQYAKGNIQIENDKLCWKGIKINNGLSTRIVSMFKQGFSIEPMIQFMEKVQQNPSEYAKEELYLFLEHNNLPITPSGNFLAYKKIREDYTDCHTGKIDNSVGKTVKMTRSAVDSNRNNTCSTGLHACSLDYLKHFNGNRTVIVEIDPRDFVSCPIDYNNAKIRVCKYKVIGEIPNTDAKSAFTQTVQSNAKNVVKPVKQLSMTPNAIRKREQRARLKQSKK